MAMEQFTVALQVAGEICMVTVCTLVEVFQSINWQILLVAWVLQLFRPVTVCTLVEVFQSINWQILLVAWVLQLFRPYCAVHRKKTSFLFLVIGHDPFLLPMALVSMQLGWQFFFCLVESEHIRRRLNKG